MEKIAKIVFPLLLIKQNKRLANLQQIKHHFKAFLCLNDNFINKTPRVLIEK